MINHTNKKHGDSAVSMGFSTMTDILGYKSITGAFISLLYTTSFLWRFLKTNLWILEDELYEGSCPFIAQNLSFLQTLRLVQWLQSLRLSFFSLLDAQRTCSVSLCVIRRNALSDFFCFSSRLFLFVAGGAQYIYVESYGVIGFITGNI